MAQNTHNSSSIGLIGLAVMGQNLALNIAQNGYKISVWNRSSSKVEETIKRAKSEGDLPVVGTNSLLEFTESLEIPRKIIILVKAGSAVDVILDQLIPLLSKGDMVIDGGNEWYKLTEDRCKRLESQGLCFMGMGISGGEKGAREGPSLMPGGSKKVYDTIEPILQKTAAKASGIPCVSYIGPGGSGNYVKMVHNGIEYGDMELIAEAYSILKRLGKYNNDSIAQIFKQWNQDFDLQSYLIEITSEILLKKDEKNPETYLVDCILDVAGSKGTGMWVVQEAATRGIPCPTIQAALDMRYLSSKKNERLAASSLYKTIANKHEFTTQNLKEDLQNALFIGKVCSYAQGMMLLQQTSTDEKWNLNLGNIAQGWRAGCIIRAAILQLIEEAYRKKPDLPSLLLDETFAEKIIAKLPALRRVVNLSLSAGVPIPALIASSTYIDSITADQLPVNLIQAQRDYFGAHTFYRLDGTGPEHANWT